MEEEADDPQTQTYAEGVEVEVGVATILLTVNPERSQVMTLTNRMS